MKHDTYKPTLTTASSMETHPFVVNVTKLLNNPGSRVTFSCVGTIPDLSVTSSRVLSEQNISVDAVFESVHSGVLVSSIIKTVWEGECRRCLSAISSDLILRTKELFCQDVALDTADTDYFEAYPLAMDKVDLEPMIRDAIVLNLPAVPLCNTRCKGLCSVCGTNLNEQMCNCVV
ncbi:MAG: DUF177 domain-containing protein [Actinobacteria bacterium]|nr:DUF177 domain-containing protein [Actinomycetota bacterium]MCL6104229.1 DUF177 domain-containing protein [Actinomycetota bacterium]